MPPQFRPQVTIPQWLQIPMNIRLRLAKIFGIQKSSGCEIVNNTVVSDGFDHEDLAGISVEKMKIYTGLTVDDFFELFNETLGKVYAEYDNEINKKIDAAIEKRDEEIQQQIDTLTEKAEEMKIHIENIGNQISDGTTPKRRGRPPKQVPTV